MKVLVTGACGVIGSVLVPRLLGEGHIVRVFDLPTDANRERAKGWNNVEFTWGDISDAGSVKKAVDDDIDDVIHLAFMLHPASEKNPELAAKVNVTGTRNVVEAIRTSTRKPKLVFASSATVFGITADEKPPIKPDHTTRETDNYSRHKIACEKLIKESKVRYTILRLSVILPLEAKLDFRDYIRSLPLEGRTELLHVQDACTAMINCLKERKSDNRVYVIAGGKKNQMRWKDMIEKIFSAFGLPNPDWSEFAKEPYYLDWYDTSESQAILQYQSRTLEDYIKELKKILGMP